LIWKEGIYEGNFNDGEMSGVGQFIFFVKSEDRFDFYSGEVKNGLPHGKGTYSWAND